MPLRNFGQKHELQYLEKYAICLDFKLFMKLNSLVHYFFFLGNYAIELMEFKLFFAKKMAVYAARKKI